MPDRLARFRVSSVPEGAAGWLDDPGCGLLHIDMDAFFAAVELRTRPELVDQPVVVAGAGARSVVLSANYPARRYGIHSAMPVAAARKLCPHATHLPPTRGLYAEVSRGVMGIFREVTPLVEQLSLDEAFLDVSGALRRLHSTPARIASGLRERINAEHGINGSVGVASVKFVAKLASSMAKPDGMVVVPRKNTLEFLHPLPASALSGVGERTAQRLRDLGLHTIGDLAHASHARLRRAVGNAAAEHLHALASGRDERAVVPDAQEKSLGAERTFDTDQRDQEFLKRELLRLSERVAEGLRAKGLRGKTVSIKVRFADFRTITRARTLSPATDVAHQLHAVASALLTEQGTIAPVRLLGLRVEGLVGEDGGEQLSFAAGQPRWRDAEVAADVARSRYGSAAIQPASLLSPYDE